MRLRTRFVAPVVAVALPLALFASAVVVIFWQHEREQLWQGHTDTARALAVAVSGEVESTRLHLRHTATSPLLAPESMAAFQRSCEELLQIRADWRRIVLFDRSGARIFATDAGGGLQPAANASAAKAGEQPYVGQVLGSRQPVLTDLFSTEDGQLAIALMVPVIKAGEAAYVLSAELRFDWFDELLHRYVPDGNAGVVDAHFRSVSRNFQAADHRGKIAPTGLLEGMRSAPEGRVQVLTFDARRADAVWVPVPETAWKIALGYPLEKFLIPLRNQVMLLSGFGLLVLLAGVLFALRTSSVLQRAIEAAGQRAAEVLQGKDIVLPNTGTLELDRLGQAISVAAEKMRKAERERDELLVREQDARALAEGANRAKDEFLAMLSHELRNPLAPILMGAQLLRMGRSADFTRDTAATIERQARQMSHLIDDLLDLTGITLGKLPLKREPVDLGRVVARLVDEWRAAGRLQQHRLSVASGSVWVQGDAARLEQVVANLLGNAVKYTPFGGEIDLRLRVEEGMAVLEVADTGRGFSEQLRQRMFDVFVQGEQKMHRPEGGLGVGLALVKRLVDLHGGSVSAYSAGLGGGAVFTVRLPAIGAPADARQPLPERRTLPPKHTILVVEDNRDARRMLRLALAEAGHEVHEAADGLAAIEAAAQLQPDIALIDIGLPGMDGYEVARKLSENASGRKPVLIALTGYGQAGDKRKAEEAGFKVHLTKPVDHARLEKIIAEALRRGR